VARWRRALLVVYTHPSDGRIAAFGEAHSGSAAVSAANAAARAAASDVGHSPFAASSSTVAETPPRTPRAWWCGTSRAPRSTRCSAASTRAAWRTSPSRSHSGDLLVTVGLDADHSVAVYVRSLLVRLAAVPKQLPPPEMARGMQHIAACDVQGE